MYAITGLTDTQAAELMVRLRAAGVTTSGGGGRPACLDLGKAVTAVLMYLRRNLAQAAIAELFGISQPTVSRTIAALEGPIEAALAEYVPTLEDLPEQLVFVFDGTLTPCWSYKDHPELFSGKHHTTGHNHQVASCTDGEIAWISNPLPGSTHDKAAWDHHHIAEHLNPDAVIADKGYQGTGAVTPRKKPVGHPLAKSRSATHSPKATAHATPASTRSAGSSNAPTLTSKPGESCTPTTDDPSTPTPKHSAPPEHSYSSPRLLNNPHRSVLLLGRFDHKMDILRGNDRVCSYYCHCLRPPRSDRTGLLLTLDLDCELPRSLDSKVAK